jgi:nucleoside-diphosphate-sugar epimerase
VNNLLIFGLGYTGQRLAHSLQREGWDVCGTVRTADKVKQLKAQDLQPVLFEEAGDLISKATHIICSIPPGEEGDPALNSYASALEVKKFQWVGYFSTTGVYGDLGGGVATEVTPTNPSNLRSLRRVRAEHKWQLLAPSAHVFRLPGIYGPGRSILDRIKGGQSSYTKKAGHRFSRIHVDDIVGAVIASINNPRHGSTYNIVDDLAAETDDLIKFSCSLLGCSLPEAIPFAEANLSPMARSFYSDNRTVSNSLMKSDLNYTLKYPSYREGLKAIFDSYSAG